MLDSRLIYAVTVAQTGSFTAAAQSVGVTQSAITKSVADLEREVGYQIFYRVARGVLLTEQGRDFVIRASRLLEDAQDLLKGSALGHDPYAGVLRIGICPASLEWLMAAPLVALLKHRPQIRFDITASTFESIIHQLRSGALDVAFGFKAAFDDWSDLRQEPLSLMRSVFFARLGHPLLGKTEVRLDDLAQYDLISVSDSRPYTSIMHDVYERHNMDWRTRIHVTDHFPTIQKLVSISDAVATVERRYAEMPQFLERFGIIPVVEELPPGRLCCAVRSRWEPKPAVRALIAELRQTLPPDA